MRFEFATATRIVFGPGSANELPALAKPFGRRALVVTGRDRIRHAGRIGDLEGAGATCTIFGVAGEPTVEIAREGAELARAAACELVIAIGGGSAIDAGKAIAALAANPGDVLDYIEVIGKAQPLTETPLPFIAMPTTAGTGSEVTRNAVLGSPADGVKASLRAASMLPKIAVVDPDLTLGLPRDITASTGLDAITQLIEPYVSSKANPMTDSLCLDGLRHARESLERAADNGRDAAARAAMSYASLLGGMALANAGLGVVHGFAAPIGGMFDAPHGAVCAAILPHGMRTNIHALRVRQPESAALVRYTEVARLLTGNPKADAEEGAEWIAGLVSRLAIPPLNRYGIAPEHFADVAAKAKRASSMKANPVELTMEELEGILSAAA